MEFLFEQLLNGLSLGCMYAFVALGYTMVYGIVRLINFAHSEFFMIGMYVGLLTLRFAGVERLPLPPAVATALSWLTAFALAALAAAVLAVVVERLAYRPIRGKDRLAALLTALGVSFFLQNAVLQFTKNVQGYPEVRTWHAATDLEAGRTFPGEAYVVGIPGGVGVEGRRAVLAAGAPVTPETVEAVRALGASGVYVDRPFPRGMQRLVVFFLMATGLAVLWVLVHRTRHGKAMRAVSYDLRTSQLMGVNVDLTISFTFFVGAAFAGVAGVAWGSLYGGVCPSAGFVPGLKAFIAAVIGGIGSLPGAALGGILLGLVETFVKAYLPAGSTGYADGVAFLGLIAILLLKPEGLLGKPEGEKV